MTTQASYLYASLSMLHEDLVRKLDELEDGPIFKVTLFWPIGLRTRTITKPK